jgi:hypothetical protein
LPGKSPEFLPTKMVRPSSAVNVDKPACYPTR